MGAAQLGPAAAVLRAIEATFAAEAPLAAGDLLVVAVSGGVDSMVLLDALWRLRTCLQVRLHVAHLDHGLRAEAAEDRALVAARAAVYGLPCTCAARDVGGLARATRRSLEDAARQARYEFLEQVAAAESARYVVLGHQALDQAETVLLHLVRGSGTAGLAGMRVVRAGRFVRPLLTVDRQQIREYAAALAVPYREDASNADRRFTRNRVRHELLPLLRRFNPRVEAALSRTATLLADEDDWLEQSAAAAFARVRIAAWLPGLCAGQLGLDVPRLLEYHIAVRRRLVRRALGWLRPRAGELGCAHVEAVVRAAAQPGGGPRQIAAGLAVQRCGDWLLLGRAEAAAVDTEVPVPGEVEVADRGLRLRARLLPPEAGAARPIPDGSRAAALDWDALGQAVRLRSLRPGDVFQPHGMAGHKKVSDFLVDTKWPRLLRPGLLVLTGADGQIAWVVGLRTAHGPRLAAHTRRILAAEVMWSPAG